MTSGGDSDDELVVETAEQRPVNQVRTGQTRPYRAVERRDATTVPLGRGTRDQPAFAIEDLPADLSHELNLERAGLSPPAAAATPGISTSIAPALAAALVAPRAAPRATPSSTPATSAAAPLLAPLSATVPPVALPAIPPLPPESSEPALPPVVRPRSTREFETRDPAEVLRMWPHTLRTPDATPLPPRSNHVAAAPDAARSMQSAAHSIPPPSTHATSPLPVSTAPRRIEDKVVLAHLALDLYRELESDVQGAHIVHAGTDTCHSQACEARVNALRGALVEACLLVQRVALLTPVAKGALEHHVRELLLLIER